MPYSISFIKPAHCVSHDSATDSLHFPLIYAGENSRGNSVVLRTCRDQDIVAHESGHAILHRLRPDLESYNTQFIWALHEAFGDITSQFLQLEEMNSKELHKWLINPITCLSHDEEANTCLRNPTEASGLRTCEIHDLSQSLSRFVYRSAAELYKWYKGPKNVLDYTKELFLMSVIETNFNDDPNAALADIALNMVHFSRNDTRNDILINIYNETLPYLTGCSS